MPTDTARAPDSAADLGNLPTEAARLPCPAPPAAEALLLTAQQAATLINVSSATWFRMAAAGRTPAPVRLSPGCVRYSRETLVEWVRLGCPPRKELEARQAAANGRK